MADTYDFQNLTFFDNEDPQFTVVMTPPEDVTGWAVDLDVWDLAGANVRHGSVGGVGTGVAVTDAVAGVFTPYFAALPKGCYRYTVKRTSPGERVLEAGVIQVVSPAG